MAEEQGNPEIGMQADSFEAAEAQINDCSTPECLDKTADQLGVKKQYHQLQKTSPAVPSQQLQLMLI